MIKMFIDNEEVVSDREFAINEEMLSASSTILNNCYPKSWELNKDYISNFYYPKDYSKFLLGEGEFEHGNAEYGVLNVSGETFIQYETNVEKEWNNFNIYGRTYQATILPSGYTQVDYIESHGTQYIDTGFNGGNNYKITCKIKDFQKGSFPFSDYKNGTANENIGLYVNVAGAYAIYHTSTNTVFQQLYNEIKEMSFTLSSTGLSYQINNLTGTLSYTPTTNNGNVVLFRRGNSATYYSLTQLYNFKIYNSSNVLVRDFIPCYRNSDNEVGLYDLVNNVFYTNLGSGSFTYGSIVNIPNPDYPSELVNVGYENYFTLDYITAAGITKNDTETNDFTYTDCWGRDIVLNPNIVKMLKPSTTYTIKYKYQVLERPSTFGQYNSSYNLGLYNGSNMIWLGITNKNSIDLNTWETITAEFTTPASLTNYRILAYNFKDTNNTTTGIIRISELIIAEKESDFIPFGKYGIQIKNIGKNLFNKDNYQNLVTIFNYNIANYHIKPIQLMPNTSYTISHNAPSTSNIIALINNIKQVNGSGFYDLRAASGLKTFTTDSTGNLYIGVVYTTTDENYNNRINECNIQIEKGNQATDFEEYKSNTQLYTLDEPLRAIGDIKDRLYIENGMLYIDRKIGKLPINTTKNWQDRPNYTNADRFVSDWFFDNTNKLIMCNYLPTSQKASTTYPYILNNNRQCIINFSEKGTTTLAQFKEWLNSNDVYYIYILTEPYIEVIGQVNIPYSYEGINNITFGTGIDTEETVHYYWKNYDVLFAGIVKNSGDISLNPRYPHYCSLQILDYKTFLSESDTLDFVIANKTVKEAINMVVNAVANYGFIVGDINISGADDIIGAYSTLNKSAYDVLQYLANISGSRWRARYVNSSTMAIDFYDPDTLPQAEDIEYTKEYWENNNIVDMTFNYGTRDYRNKQILLSDEVYANINYDETLISNGYGNTFTVQNNIGLVVSVIVNNQEKTVGTNNDKKMGIDADFYYTPGKNIIESNMIYPASTLIHLTYQPLVKGRQIVYNNSEVDRISRQTDTEGVIARYETRNDILSSDELEKIAQTYIEYKGKAEVILTLKTQNKDLYNIGEVVYFNAPIDELKQNYMVKTKQIEYVVINDIINLFYIYEMTSSFNSEKAINYFDNQRNKASGNIADGESITRNIDIETGVGIIWTEGSVSSTSVTVTGDNLLNSALNSPFVE